MIFPRKYSQMKCNSYYSKTCIWYNPTSHELYKTIGGIENTTLVYYYLVFMLYYFFVSSF